MIRKVILRPEAEADIQSTYLWYQEQNIRLGADFLRCVEAGLASVEQFPLAYPRIHKQIRRTLLRRFPYGLFYIVERDCIIVLAVFHFKRDTHVLLNLFEDL